MSKKIDIEISPDQLSAKLSVKSKGNGFPTEQEIKDHLKEAGVCYGIKADRLQKICRKKEPVSDTIIAEGQTPHPGQDAQLVWHLEDDVGIDKVQIDESGTADFKHAKSFNKIQKGEQIVSKLPKKPGRPGKTVTGKIIESGEKDFPLPSGENIDVSEDGLTLTATKSGFLNIENGKVNISNIYQVDGDVSFNSGNVMYDGKVVIKGDVRSGFRVDATDDIFIEGDVEAAEIRSKKGNITIKMGVLGKGRAKIIAGGKIHCGFIQDSDVKANSDIIADHYIINSDVYAGGIVYVNEHEGLIRGGSVYGEKGITTKEVGSVKKIRTQLGIGLTRSPEKENKLNHLIKNEDKLYKKFELLSKKERFLKLLYERVGKLSDQKQKELDHISKELQEIKVDLNDIEDQKTQLSQKSQDLSDKNKIIIQNKLHEGVTLTTGSDEIYIDKLYEHVTIYQDLDNIVIDDLKIEQE